MSEPTSAAVECPICGEEFDPSAAGGWCTNPDCGEWQYLGEEVPDPVESDDAPTTAESSDEAAESDDGDDEPASPAEAVEEGAAAAGEMESPDTAEDDDDVSEAAAEQPDEPVADEADTEPAEAAESTAGEAEEVAAEADEVVAETDDVAAEAEEPTPDEVAEGDTGAEAEEEEGPSQATCPDCGAAVDDDDNFCADCGADLTGAEPTLEECPDCGADVAEDDSFCANCGEDLEAAREELTDAGGSAPVGDDAVGDAAAEGEGEAPESLVLSARGEEIAVADDDTVGREVRRILTESGADEDEAVRIHREHVRFVREGGQFYLVDLGDNPTALNDRRLTKGDREPVEPGDEIELSGVVTLSVDAP